MVARGDSRIAMTIGRNSKTAKFGRQRRFLIDDQESPIILAYALTKPLKLYTVFNGEGAFSFVLQEVDTTDDDNQEERIADYYKYFPKSSESSSENNGSGTDPQETPAGEGGKKVWL